MRTTVTALATAAMLAAAALVAAPAASAATTTVSACAGLGESEIYFNIYVIELGDTLVFTSDGLIDDVPEEIIPPLCVMVSPEQATVSVTLSSLEDVAALIAYSLRGAEPDLVVGAHLNYVLPCGSITVDELAAAREEIQNIYPGSAFSTRCGGGDQTPPAVLQQTTPLPDGSCAITSPEFNIGGAEGGGWSTSWADWVNPGSGGAVCTRTLEYSAALAHWVAA